MRALRTPLGMRSATSGVRRVRHEKGSRMRPAQRVAFLLLVSLGSACVARTPPAIAREDPSDWLARLTPVLDPLVPPVPATPPAMMAYPTLGDIAKAEGWEDCGACRSDSCSCFETRGRAVFPGGDGFDEVRLVGQRGSTECAWSLIAKTAEGWLAPLSIGSSPAGCTTTIDADTFALGGRWWFPLAFVQDPSDPRILRSEGQGNLPQDLYQGGLETLAPRRIDRVVVLCRVDGRTLACSTRQVSARVVTTTLLAPLPAALTDPLPPDPTFTPLSDAAHIARDWDTEWRVRPLADPERTLYGFGNGVVQRAPFRAGEDIVVVSGERYVRVLRVRGPVAFEELTAIESLGNAAYHLDAIATAPGVVRVRITRTVDGRDGGGGKDALSVAWHWEEIFVAAPVARHFRLLTGITLTRGGETLARWQREVVPEPGGLRLVERAGTIAWFRGTGRYTWDALAARLPHWRLQMAEAFQAVPPPPRKPASQADAHEYVRDSVGTLELLPGTIEPLYDVFLDEAIPLD